MQDEVASAQGSFCVATGGCEATEHDRCPTDCPGTLLSECAMMGSCKCDNCLVLVCHFVYPFFLTGVTCAPSVHFFFWLHEVCDHKPFDKSKA